jgi:hypothetical protein
MKQLLIEIAKFLLKMALDKTVREALPKIYETLDTSIPKALVAGAPPIIIKSEITHAAAKLSRKGIPPTAVEAIALLYNPVKNALRTQNKLQ